MNAPPSDDPVPMAEVIAIDADGAPYLAGLLCTACGEVMPGRHIACPKCFTVGKLEPVRLGMTGTIFAWTIVERSFPGVKVPLVSAVVALDGGGYLKGNVEGLVPDPQVIADCRAVRADFETLIAPDGAKLVRYVFHPLQEPGR